jgi:multiple antibiotic resistance protein
MNFQEFINSFVSLLVIANPLSALPAVLRITRNQSLSEKRTTGLTCTFAVAIILFTTAWIGKPLLMLLGIQLSAFQVAGGVILLLMAISMLSAEESPIKQAPEEHKVRRPSDTTGAIVPLAIPIIAGPGAISTVIVHVNAFPGAFNQFILSASCLLVAFVIGILLYFASNLERILGQSGINIINRLGGLILAAIAMQTMANGLKGLFPLLGTSPM